MLTRLAVPSVTGEELIHLAADMKRSSPANKTAKARFSAFVISRPSGSMLKREGSDGDEPKHKKKAKIKFRVTGGRGKSFTSIAKSMFAKHKDKLVLVDVEPLPNMPEPHAQDGCIFIPPLPPSERQLATGANS